MTGRFASFRPRPRPSTPARVLASELTDFLKRYRSDAEASLAKPFKGVTTDGRVVPGLFTIDHQRGIALDNDEPSRNHIHTVVRTPNGNDYGRDLLRQHHEQFDHTRPGLPHSHAHAGRSGPRDP